MIPINYVELPAKNFAETQAFFEQAFGWQFQSFGEFYMAFSNSGVMGGFYQSDLASQTQHGGALIVLYSKDLEATLQTVIDHGAGISKDIFSFPGGRRFQFIEPSGNELAVWSDK